MSTFAEVRAHLEAERDKINAALNDLNRFQDSDDAFGMTTAQKDRAVASHKALLPEDAVVQAFDGS